MVALFHTKSRTCINRFVKASRASDALRFEEGRKAADVYLKAHAKRCDAARTQQKIEKLLKRIAPSGAAALSVAEVSLAGAMQKPMLEAVAQKHINAASDYLRGRAWPKVEQELQVVEALYAAQSTHGPRPSAEVSVGTQDIRDRAAELRCSEHLKSAWEACRSQSFSSAYGHIDDLRVRLKQLLPTVSPDVQRRLEKIAAEADDLFLTVELADDQAVLRRAEEFMAAGAPREAEVRFQQVLKRIDLRPHSHPSYSDKADIRHQMHLCAEARHVDADYEHLLKADERGDLVQYARRATELHEKLRHLPSTLPTKTARGFIVGLRSWDPRTSKLRVYAEILETAEKTTLSYRKITLDNIRAMARLEGPAGDFSIHGNSQNPSTPKGAETYAYKSMKERIANEAPTPPKNCTVTLKMGGHRMYFHSCNYKTGVGEIIAHAPLEVANYFSKHHDSRDRAALFDALGFTCIEAQLTALAQAQIDPLQEDLTGKHTPRQKSDEYMRVFHLKAIRRYAAENSLNPIDHADTIDAKKEFTDRYFNAKRFVAYMEERGYKPSKKELKDILDYQINEVCVLSD